MFEQIFSFLGLRILPQDVRAEAIILIQKAAELRAAGQLNTGREQRVFVVDSLLKNPVIRTNVMRLMERWGGEWIFDVAVKFLVAKLEQQ